MAALDPERLTSILNSAELGHLEDWADLCDRMVEIDSTVRASLETRYAAIAGARCIIEPGRPTGDPRRDVWAADAANVWAKVIADIETWPTHVMELLHGIGVGIGCLSLEWQWNGYAIVPRPQWVHARRFRWWRPDWTLRLRDDGERVYSPGLELDPDCWCIHAPKTIAGYPTRVGVLRAAAWPFVFKRWAVQFWNAGAERFAWPLLVAKVPRGAAADTRAAARQGLETLSSDHSAVVEDPAAFEILETTIKDNGTWKQLVDAMNAEIAKGILGMTDMNEPGRIGAYAAVEVRRGTTVDARIAMDELQLAATVKQQLARAFFRFNAHLFGGVVPPIPETRWVIAAKRAQIPPDFFGDTTLNERRASIDLDPRPDGEAPPSSVKQERDGLSVAGGASASAVQDTALNGAQVASLQGMLASVKDGSLAPDAAKIAIAAAFPTFDAAQVSQMVSAQVANPSQVATTAPGKPLPSTDPAAQSNPAQPVG